MPRLYKKEKLCSTLAIEQLFARGGAEFSHLAFPLRAVARANNRRHSDAPVAFLISVPKRRLRHAVDRVLMRRRIREAYRLLRDSLELPAGKRIDLAFIYVADKPKDFGAVKRAMERLLTALGAYYQEPAQCGHETTQQEQNNESAI